jgi:hypothetical protein
MKDRLNILHLSRREDRYEKLMDQLQTNSISKYTLWEGFDDPTNVKQAITRGHKEIIRFAKISNHENCIIAEDDIVFSHPNSYKYFLSQIPESYDLFCGLIYAGDVFENRIMNGMSGTQTLYSIHNRFYDFVLGLDDNDHIDRNLGNYAFEKEYFVCDPMVCTQSGGYSDNLRRVMYYDVYLEGKTLYLG